MARLTWDTIGERFYETGVDRGVLYIDDVGYPWSGIVSVEESPSGGEARTYYVDGVMYLNLSSREEFGATLSAFYSPKEFDVCDGAAQVVPGMFAKHQRRKSFGLSYRTLLGNDVAFSNYGYKIHIVYNALAQPSVRHHVTSTPDNNIPLLAWDLTAKPVLVPGAMPTAHLVIDTTLAPAALVTELEGILYGDEITAPRLPTPTEIEGLFDSSPFTVTDLGSGEFSISGTDFSVAAMGGGAYQIVGDGVSIIDTDSAEISS